MSKIFDALKDIERRLADERGSFTLFALFEREDIPTHWDLVVAAPWVERDNGEALRVLADEMKQHLSKDDLVRIARIVLLDPDDANVRAITSEHSVEHGRVAIDEASHYGFPVERGYVITARRAA